MDAIGGAIKETLGLKQTKAQLVIKSKNAPKDKTPIECMFNPTQYKLAQKASATRTKTPKKNGGYWEYKSTSQMTLTMELFFDDFASIEGDVTPKIIRLLSWQQPTEMSIEKKRPRPPLIGFKWGNSKQLGNFKGLLTNVTVTYLIFRKDGTPVQAKVDITIEGTEQAASSPTPPQNPTSHAIDSRRIRLPIEGDSLQSIAFEEFGSPTHWRAIADLNNVDDPLRLRIGVPLVIPTAADAARTR